MLLTYICEKCGSKRFFTSVKTETPTCNKCGGAMSLKKDNITHDSFTTEEARFLADEALYNTVADRISKKHRVKHT